MIIEEVIKEINELMVGATEEQLSTFLDELKILAETFEPVEESIMKIA